MNTSGVFSKPLARVGGLIEWPFLTHPRDRSVYDLVLFTQHEQGVWFFNDSVSLARKVFETYWEDGLGFFQSQLWDPEDQWVAEISANIQALYRSGEQIRVIDHMYSIYGETLGHARGIHVKQAVRELAAAGFLIANLNVEPHELVIGPGPTHRANLDRQETAG